MLAQFNWVDVLSMIFIVSYAALIFRRGFLAEFFEFLGFTISLGVAVVVFPYLGSFLHLFGIPVAFADTVAFLLLWVVTELFSLTLFRDFIRKLPMAVILSNFNRYYGILPNLMASFAILAFVGTILIVLPTPTSIKTSLVQSRLVGSILPLTSSFSPPIETAFSQSIRDGLILTSGKTTSEFIHLNIPKTFISEDLIAEAQLYALLNQARRQNLVPALTLETNLSSVARGHSEDMFKRNYFGHVDPDSVDPLERVSRAGIYVTSLAENISYAPDVTTAHTSFLDSPEHRKNMLSKKYTRVGIGIADSARYGEMFTELFAN